MSNSILSPDMKGVMFLSGYRGKGKTFLAAHVDFPQNIVLFDFDEGKAEGLHNQLGFGKYIPVEENEPLKRADLFFNEVENLKQDKFTVAIIDNVAHLEKALQAVVYRDARRYAGIYGYSVDDVKADNWGKARGIMNDLIGDAIAKPLHVKGVKLIIVTSHVKDKFNTPGKMVIQGRDRWQELSILTLILVNGDNPPAPSAIVQKESLGKISSIESAMEVDEKTIQAVMRGEVASHTIVPRLPARIPIADWQSIRQYLYRPADLKNPTKGEKLIPEEVEPFSEVLSKEQIAYQLGAMKKEEEERQRQNAVSLLLKQSQVNKMKEFTKGLTGPGPIKVQIIKDKIEAGELVYDDSVTITKINEWSK